MRRSILFPVWPFLVIVCAAATRAEYTLTTLASFDFANGYSLNGDLLADADGNLYGTTTAGGTCGAGTLCKLSLIPELPSVAVAFVGVVGLMKTGAGRRI